MARAEEVDPAMVLIGLALLVCVVLAGLVTAFVAYPHRGESIPHARWLSDTMSKTRDRINDKLPQ